MAVEARHPHPQGEMTPVLGTEDSVTRVKPGAPVQSWSSSTVHDCPNLNLIQTSRLRQTGHPKHGVRWPMTPTLAVHKPHPLLAPSAINHIQLVQLWFRTAAVLDDVVAHVDYVAWCGTRGCEAFEDVRVGGEHLGEE